MAINEKDINEFKSKNQDKIKMAANMARNTLGKDADKLTAMLSDKETLNKFASSLSKNDLEKISKVLDNPEMLKQILTNEKTKESLKKMMGEK